MEHHGHSIITSGLVLHLDAANPQSYDGNSNIWRDLSGNNNHGTLTNSPTYNSLNKGSIVFDGINDYVNCGNSSTLQITNNQLTIEIIFKTSYNPGSGYFPCLVSKRYSWGVSNTQYSLFIDNVVGNRKILSTIGTTTGTIYLSSNTKVNDDTVHNTVLLYDGNNLSLYNNGMLDCTPVTAYGNILNIDTNVYIGAANAAGSLNSAYYYKDKIYEVRIYNRSLSQQEILQNYNSTKNRYL